MTRTRRVGVGIGLVLALALLPAGVNATSGSVKKPNQAPKVRIVNVGCDDDLIAPADITITADASDADGSVKSVRFFAGSTSIGNETKAPFSVKWRAVSAGTYALTAVATDNSGAETTSAAVMVTVKKNGLPSVRMTAPSAGASFIEPEALEVSADASDGDGGSSRSGSSTGRRRSAPCRNSRSA